MPRQPAFHGHELTRHHPAAPRFGRYKVIDLAKFYGLIAGIWYGTSAAMVRYGQLFENYQNDAEKQQLIYLFAFSSIILVTPIVLYFFWWCAGQLTAFSRWQRSAARFWRGFWLFILLFYGYVLLDPLDSIHPLMSRKGLAPAPNLIELLGNGLSWPLPVFQFQWGYFLLWLLFWFLVLALFWCYISDGLREAWFYVQRFRRYGVSILLGFRETARLANSAPVTRDYPRQRPNLPPVYRGVPRLNVERLSTEEAALLRASDTSGALSSPPGQPDVLFVDLGAYDFSPALAAAQRADGTPLLRFSDYWPRPHTKREDLLIPLAGGTQSAASTAAGNDNSETEPQPRGAEA